MRKINYNLKKILGLLSCSILFLTLALSCERDDICAADTPTTPRLVIDFLNISDLASPKTVPLLAIKGVGNDMILENFRAVNTRQIILPLKTNENSTQFSLYRNAEIDGNETIISGNEDLITITYTPIEVFVSRACGYKTIYKDVAIQFENDTDNWIQVILPLNDNQSVEDETTTHFNIFH